MMRERGGRPSPALTSRARARRPGARSCTFAAAFALASLPTLSARAVASAPAPTAALRVAMPPPFATWVGVGDHLGVHDTGPPSTPHPPTTDPPPPPEPSELEQGDGEGDGGTDAPEVEEAPVPDVTPLDLDRGVAR
jgi:hypothetical protein